MPLLDVNDLTVAFATHRGVAKAVNGVNLHIEAGTMHGLVGESGSGKSVTSRAVLGLLSRRVLARETGQIRFNGADLLAMTERQLRNEIRGQKISMVFQDPMTALAPAMRIGVQIMLPLRQHLKLSRTRAKARALELLEDVGIPDPARRFNAYPHELSGGQRQRVTIAIAVACDPALLIADEATTALDVTVQAQILDLFDKLRRERNVTILMVSHDLGLIAERCDTVSVMYAGRVVEEGPAQRVFDEPQHPYTRLLGEARPKLGDPPHIRLTTIPGRLPDVHVVVAGCPFAARCPNAQPDCTTLQPPLSASGPGRSVACLHPIGAVPTPVASSTGTCAG